MIGRFHVTSALDQTFDTAADLIIGATTIAVSGLTTVVSVTVPDAVGTLRTALTGSGMTSIVIDVASSVFFHVYNNLVIDSLLWLVMVQHYRYLHLLLRVMAQHYR